MIRNAAILLVAMALASGLVACGDGGRSKVGLPPEAVEGNGDTPYPGVLDERLSESQRNELRERGNLQR